MRAAPLIVTAAIIFAPFVHAADMVRAGDYENPNGALVISDKANALEFEIEAFGANGHTCSLNGDIHDNQATLDGEEGACIVKFDANAKGVDVQGNDACRFYCGMRAHFDGTYFKPAAGCATDDRTHSRDAFKAAYAKKDYAKARAKLEPVLAQCASLLSWLETASVRNDLAVTQYHLNDRAGCLSTLEPLAADAAKSDASVRENLPPTDAEDYLPLVKAARTNLKLCKSLPAP